MESSNSYQNFVPSSTSNEYVFCVFVIMYVCITGRLMDNKSNALAKDEMLAMIRHGANEVFKGKDDEFTDEDIDAIIGRGEERVCIYNMFVCCICLLL